MGSSKNVVLITDGYRLPSSKGKRRPANTEKISPLRSVSLEQMGIIRSIRSEADLLSSFERFMATNFGCTRGTEAQILMLFLPALESLLEIRALLAQIGTGPTECPNILAEEDSSYIQNQRD